MERKIVVTTMLTLLLASVFMAAFSGQRFGVEASLGEEFGQARSVDSFARVDSPNLTSSMPLSTPIIREVDGALVPIPPGPSQNHWWDITFWTDTSGGHLPSQMDGQFIAVSNTIGNLGSSDSVLYLPLNVAYGTSRTNCVWFQFDIQFDPNGAREWYIWDINGPGTNESIWPNGDYHYTSIGIAYTPGDVYSFSLTTSGTNTVTFSIVDTTTGTSWSKHDWIWTVSSLDMLYDTSMFSPASAVEGRTTNNQLTNVPYFQTKVGHGINNYWHSPPTSAPSGIGSDVNVDSSGYYYWYMYSGRARTPVFTLSPLPVVYVDPSAIPAYAGQQFNVSVYVSSAVELDLFAWQMNMTWANGILNYESVTWGDEGANMTVGTGSAINISSDGTGQLLYDGVCLGRNLYVAVTSVNSPLLLFNVTFKAISTGTSPINLINVELFGISDDGNGWPTSTFPPSISTFHGISEFTQYDRWPDIDDDGKIDIYDVIILSRAFGSSPGQKNWNPACDFNEDGVVDFFDALILLADYNKISSDPTWPSPACPLGLTNTIYEFNETVQNGSAYATDEWPMFHHDLAHTGYSTSTAPTTNQTLWNYTTGGGVDSSPAVVGGMVFVGSGDGKVYALDATTGAQIWNYTTGNAVSSSPAVVGGMVFVGSWDGKVYALDAATGGQIWNYTTGAVGSSPTVVGGVVYVGSLDNNKTYALSAATGALIWSYTTGDEVWSSPVVVGGVVYVGSGDHKVYALNATTGAQIWNYTTGWVVHSSPTVVGGVVYVGSWDGKVYALDAATGAEVWSYTTGGWVWWGWSSPAVVGGVVYVGSGDGKVYAFGEAWPMFHHDLAHTGYSTSTAPNTNQLLWNYTTGDWVASSPAVVGGIVYVDSGDHNVYALNATTGQKIWNYTTNWPVYSSPVLADGKVYVGSGDVYATSWNGGIYCLDASSGALIWSDTIGTPVESSPAVANGMVFIGSCDNNVSALNATTGQKIWSFQTLGWVMSSPAVVGGIVYVGSNDTNVYALNAATGAKIWNWTTGNYVDSSPAIADGIVFVGSGDNNVYALNATTGVFIWSSTTGYHVESSPAVVGGVVFVGSDDWNVYALNAATGAKMWKYKTVGVVFSSPGVADGKVYVGSYNGYGQSGRAPFYCLNASTGAFIWSYETNTSTIDGSPAILDGIVYIGVDEPDDNVYAFGVHDVAVTNVTSSKNGCLPMPTVGQGYSATINVTVANQGGYTEIFNVTAYANATAIQTETLTLTSQNSTTLTFTWNTTGFAYGNYTISAYAWPVPGETNTTNNNLTDGTVKVTIPGDINGDGTVNILDAIRLGNAFLATPGSPNWNPNADINGNDIVNILDAIILGSHFLQSASYDP